MQDFVLRDRRHHERDRDGFEQLALGDCRAFVGGHFLLDQTAVIQLRQHAVEAAHQATELVARVPARPQSVVTGRAHAVGDVGEPAHR